MQTGNFLLETDKVNYQVYFAFVILQLETGYNFSYHKLTYLLFSVSYKKHLYETLTYFSIKLREESWIQIPLDDITLSDFLYFSITE